MCISLCECVLPGPVCSVWPAGSVHHEDPLSRLGNGTEVTSSSDLRCQKSSGRKDPWVPNICIHTYEPENARGKDTNRIIAESNSSTQAGERIMQKVFQHYSFSTNLKIVFHHYLNSVPAISHPLVEPGREELGLLGNVSGIHDLVALICPVKNKWSIDILALI